MRNPIFVFLITLEHLTPAWITERISQFYMFLYPNRFEYYCIICGRKYTTKWWEK